MFRTLEAAQNAYNKFVRMHYAKCENIVRPRYDFVDGKGFEVAIISSHSGNFLTYI